MTAFRYSLLVLKIYSRRYTRYSASKDVTRVFVILSLLFIKQKTKIE